MAQYGGIMILGTNRPGYTKQHSYQRESTEYIKTLETKVIELAWELAKRDKAIAVLQEKIRLYEGGEKLKEKWEELENVNNKSKTSDGIS